MRYTKLGKTKKVLVDSTESKSNNLADYITSQIGDQSRYLAYGSSSKLSALSMSDVGSRAYDIASHDISDSGAIEYIERMDQADILDQMESDLTLLQNVKTMDRVIFKKDFNSANLAKLQKLYIDKRMKERFIDNCQKRGIDISFEIVVIDHQIKDFAEGRELKLMENHGGVVGITYY